MPGLLRDVHSGDEPETEVAKAPRVMADRPRAPAHFRRLTADAELPLLSLPAAAQSPSRSRACFGHATGTRDPNVESQ